MSPEKALIDLPGPKSISQDIIIGGRNTAKLLEITEKALAHHLAHLLKRTKSYHLSQEMWIHEKWDSLHGS